MKNEREMGRRELLRRGVRWAALTGLGAGTGVLALRGRAGACSGGGFCVGCPALAGCGLPRAKSTRNVPAAGE